MNRTILFLTLSGLLAGCQLTRVDVHSTSTVPEAFHYAPQNGSSQDIIRWWENWHNPELSALIEQGLSHNFTLAAARERMQAAAAFSDAARADLLPQAGISAQLGRHNINADNPLKGIGALPPPLTATMPDSTDIDGNHRFVTFAASWEPDIFGQKSSDADAVKQQALSAKESFHGAQTAIAAQIADAYFAIAALDAQRTVLDDSIRALNELERYAQGRYRAGQATLNDVRNSTAHINNLRAQRAPLIAQRAQTEQKLAILLGQSPQTFRLAENPAALARLPAAPSGISPSQVIERRPDLRARAALVQAAAAKVASAKADLLPRFYLNFMLQDGRIGISSGPDLSAGGSLISAGVKLPIFTAGRIAANIRAQNALLNAALADYEHTLLTALQEADSAYHLRSALDQHLSELTAAENTLQQRARDSRRFYENGYHSYQDVLNARLDALKYRDDLITARHNAARATITLYGALGGGWQAATDKDNTHE